MNDVSLNIDLDWFNILNAGTVLGRQYDVGAAAGADRSGTDAGDHEPEPPCASDSG